MAIDEQKRWEREASRRYDAWMHAADIRRIDEDEVKRSREHFDNLFHDPPCLDDKKRD